MSNKKVEETVASGSGGAHSIAVRTDGAKDDFPMQRRGGSFLDFMGEFNSRLKNRVNMKPVSTGKPFSKKLKENTSLDQIYSKLGSIRNQGRMEDNDAVTYGVEDDDGNLMKITVKADQSEKFEVALAQELGELENYKMTGRGGYGREVSIAEVLYNLKQEFDIITVEFPEIPSDKVYNADKVSDPEDVEFGEEEFQKDDADFSDALSRRFEKLLEQAPLARSKWHLMVFAFQSYLSNTYWCDLEGGDELGDLEGGDEELSDEEGMPEDEEDLGVEFGDEEEGGSDASSLLKNIVQMLTKQAEAQAAEAEAEAEKSRALQAEYTAMAAKEEMAKQTELAKMEREMEAQKEREKDAKKMAELARHKLSSVSEGGSFLGALMELDDLESEQTMRMKRRQAQQIEDPTERRLRLQSLTSERRLVRHRDENKKREREEEKRAEEEGNDNKPQTIYNRGEER